MDITFELLIVLCVFWSISLWTLFRFRERALQRAASEWLLDTLGLLQQGFLFPLIQTYFLFKCFELIIPDYKGIFHLSWAWSFLLQFVLIDYMYYWNHRLLHKKIFWPLHRIHHSAKKLDVWVSSRNSFLSSFFIIYLWIHSFFIYLLNDAAGFLMAIAIGNALDLWRHSGMRFPGNVEKTLGTFLIMPHDHEWHHSSEIYDTNFGANFVWWDRLHNTYYKNKEKCSVLGESINGSFWVQWLTPWRLK